MPFVSSARKHARNPRFQKLLFAFIIFKILVISAAFMSTFYIPEELTNRKSVLDDPFLNAFAQYDARAYLDIAENGYNQSFLDKGNLHFYPLYPLLIIAFSFMGSGLAAFLLSNLFSLASLMALYFLLKDEFGSRHSLHSSLMLLAFPAAFYLTMIYTESLFLFLSIMTFYFSRKERWILASLFGFLSSLSRIQGFFLFFPVVYMYLRSRGVSSIFELLRLKWFKLRSLPFLLILAGPLLVSLYHLYAFGDFFAQSKSLAIWGKPFALPWSGFLQSFYAFADTSLINMSFHLFNIFMIVLFTVLLYYSWSLLKKEYFIYMFLSYIIVFFGPNLFGFIRYVLVLFPMYPVLSMLYDRSKKWKFFILTMYALFIVVMVASVTMHVNERVQIGLFFDPLI